MYKKVKVYYEPHVHVNVEIFEDVEDIVFIGDNNFIKITQQKEVTFILADDVKRIEASEGEYVPGHRKI